MKLGMRSSDFGSSFSSSGLEQRSFVRRIFDSVDGVLLFILGLIALVSLITMYSAASDMPHRFEDHVRNMIIGFCIVIGLSYVPAAWFMRLATPLYVVGVVLLVGVAVAGLERLGAKRWLNIGITIIQPSELLKIAVPLMLSYFFHIRGNVEGRRTWQVFAIAGVLLLIPFALIAKQPDLGTALLVVFSGSFTIFFAGINWKVIVGVFASAALLVALAMHPSTKDYLLKPYQQKRIEVLINPEKADKKDRYQVEQGMTAIGSGGVIGKGWDQGTQTHLQFLPERSTDFVLAVYSEEFGLTGVILLLVLYLLLIFRGLSIAYNGATRFERLLASTISMMIFTYVFVNMGMVLGMLPVVGVPLPFMSYGGTALVTLSVGCGILMSVRHHRIR